MMRKRPTFQTDGTKDLHYPIRPLLPFAALSFDHAQATHYRIFLVIDEVCFRTYYDYWYTSRVVGEGSLTER